MSAVIFVHNLRDNMWPARMRRSLFPETSSSSYSLIMEVYAMKPVMLESAREATTHKGAMVVAYGCREDEADDGPSAPERYAYGGGNSCTTPPSLCCMMMSGCASGSSEGAPNV